MNKVLRISTSILGDNSVSASLMAELLQGLDASGEQIELVDRDFSAEAIPHIDGSWLEALSTAESDRSNEQQTKVDLSDRLIAEVQQADTIIIALPMYNFSVPSMLKAWVDHIARAGVTFTYTDSGPKGLLENKRVFLVTTMGGRHEEGQSDFLRPYMRLIMGFIGLEDVSFVTANGLNMGDEARAAGLAAARQEIAEIVKETRLNTAVAEEAA